MANGKDKVEEMQVSSQIIDVPIDRIAQIENARSEYRESDLSELMASMKQIGLLQAIGIKALDKKHFQIVFGNRRYLAAKKLGWQTIPSVMTTADTEEDFLLKNTTENIVRTGVPLSEQGRIFHRLTKLGLTTSEIASRIGVGVQVVATALDLFRAVPRKYQEKIITGNYTGTGGRGKKGMIPMASAKAIKNAQRDFELNKEDTEHLYELASQDGISVESVKAVSRLVGQGFPIKDAVKKSLNTTSVRVSVIIENDEIERIEKKYNTSARAFLYGIIVGDGRIKVLKRGI